MEEGVVALGAYANIGGKAAYHYVVGPDDAMYGVQCNLCERYACTGTVLICLEMVWARQHIMCKDCLSFVLENAPATGREAKVEKITKESPLIDWINEAEGSMETL